MKGFKMTIDDLVKLKNEGHIRGFKIKDVKPEKPKLFIEKKEYKSVGKEYIYQALLKFALEHNTKVTCEFKFANKFKRNFRSDWAIEDMMVLIEYEGIYSEKSRHTFFKGYSKDVQKYNMAVKLGYKVFRYTADNYHEIDTDLIYFI